MSRPNYAFLDYEYAGPKPIAHRGGNLGPENTLKAFHAAREFGFPYIETDVFLAASGEVMAGHFENSKRKSKKSGLPYRNQLQGMSLDELHEKIQVDGEPVPLLEEALIDLPDIRFNIDPKTHEVVGPLSKLLSKLESQKGGILDRICINSFSYARTLGVVEPLGGQDRICTGVAVVGFMALKLGSLDYLRNTKAGCLQFDYRHINRTNVEWAHDAGLDMHLWTPNTKEDIEKCLDLGVDGIMTDELELLSHCYADRGL